jgi:hypothetical protein
MLIHVIQSIEENPKDDQTMTLIHVIQSIRSECDQTMTLIHLIQSIHPSRVSMYANTVSFNWWHRCGNHGSGRLEEFISCLIAFRCFAVPSIAALSWTSDVGQSMDCHSFCHLGLYLTVLYMEHNWCTRFAPAENVFQPADQVIPSQR